MCIWIFLFRIQDWKTQELCRKFSFLLHDLNETWIENTWCFQLHFQGKRDPTAPPPIRNATIIYLKNRSNLLQWLSCFLTCWYSQLHAGLLKEQKKTILLTIINNILGVFLLSINLWEKITCYVSKHLWTSGSPEFQPVRKWQVLIIGRLFLSQNTAVQAVRVNITLTITWSIFI